MKKICNSQIETDVMLATMALMLKLEREIVLQVESLSIRMNLPEGFATNL